MSRAALAGWFPLLAIISGALAAQDVSLEWIDVEELATGRVLIDFGDDPRFRGHIRAAVRVAASAEQIWRILEDCQSAPEYVPHVLECELMETLDEQRAQIFRQRVKLTWFIPSFDHEFRLDYEPFSRIGVSRVSGPFDELEGSWWLVPDSGERTMLIYELTFDPGLPIPRFAVGRMLRRDVPIVLAAIRERAEANAAGP